MLLIEVGQALGSKEKAKLRDFRERFCASVLASHNQAVMGRTVFLEDSSNPDLQEYTKANEKRVSCWADIATSCM